MVNVDLVFPNLDLFIIIIVLCMLRRLVCDIEGDLRMSIRVNRVDHFIRPGCLGIAASTTDTCLLDNLHIPVSLWLFSLIHRRGRVRSFGLRLIAGFLRLLLLRAALRRLILILAWAMTISSLTVAVGMTAPDWHCIGEEALFYVVVAKEVHSLLALWHGVDLR